MSVANKFFRNYSILVKVINSIIDLSVLSIDTARVINFMIIIMIIIPLYWSIDGVLISLLTPIELVGG